MGRKNKVFVAMSGGVDSSVAAFLLKKRKQDVTGVYMKGWSLTGCAEDDATDARRVAGQLKIPFYVFDFEKEFKTTVVDYMVSEYALGRTPNPDVMCNREIKFGLFLKKALALGANFIATGHYVRLLKSKNKYSLISLAAAKDISKDQSYFLWTLAQDQLRHCIFPISDYTKSQVRAMAKKWKLPTAEKPDSQGVCFIGEIDVAEFLKSQLGKNPGSILTLDGKKVGVHDGLSFYTIGQRKGIGAIGGGTPYYVVKKDFENNALIVAKAADEELFKQKLLLKDVNWISGKTPELPLKCLARIRYRQPLQSCGIAKIKNQPSTSRAQVEGKSKIKIIEVKFDKPQRAVTPGQSAVFYTKSGKIIGGGVIV